MEAENEFSVYVFSNACTSSHPKNTLTQFTNNTPYRISLPTDENWYVCAESVGFSANFNTIIPPVNNNLPNIIICTTRITYKEFLNGDDAGILDPVGSIRFPEGILTIENILKSLKVLDDFDIVYNVTSDSYLEFYIKGDSKKFYCLYIHEDTMADLQLSNTGMKKLSLVGDNYYARWLTPGGGAILGSKKKWYKKLPEIVKIECPEICEQIYNNQLTRDLKVFFPLINEKMGYFYQEFLVRQYVKLSNCDISKLSIAIKDEKNENLPLKKGFASFVKLNFTKMPYNYECFNVGVTSDGDGCFFTSNLPRTYYLNSNWKVSLSAINFPNNFYPLSYEKDLRVIYYGLTDGPVKEVIIPNIMWTENTLIAYLNETIESVAHLSAITTSDNRSIYNLKLKHGGTVLLPSSVCDILGFEYTAHQTQEYCIEKKHGILFFNIFNPSTTDKSSMVLSFIDILMNKPLQMSALKPQYIMLYADFIKPSIVGDSYSKLLKIIQIPNHNANYHTEEFQLQESHSLENTLIQTMHFELRSHTGELINFANNKNTFLNLFFSKNK